MGWKITAGIRDAWLETALTGSPTTKTPDTQMVFVDGPAMARYMMVGKTQRNPRSIAMSVWRMIDPKASTVFIGFDNPNLGDPGGLRIEVAATRASACKVKPLSPDIVESIKEESLPVRDDGSVVTWEEQLASTAGKRAAFLVVMNALKRIVIESSDKRSPQLVTITPPFGGADGSSNAWHYPFDTRSQFESVLQKYPAGEAEAQIAYCLKHVIHTALQTNQKVPRWTWISIDTDVFIQCLGFPPINGTLVVGRGFEMKGIIYASETAATKALAMGPKRLKISPSKVWRHYNLNVFMQSILGGSSAALFAKSQLLMLCAAGVDYCSGLGRFGWTSNRMLSSITDNSATVIAGNSGDLKVNMRQLRAILIQTRRSRRQDKDVAQFVEELARILYCMRYYSWNAPCSAVFCRDEIAKLDATTIDEWLCAPAPDPWLVSIGGRACQGDATAEPLLSYNVFTN